MSARTSLLFARRSTAVTLVAPEDGGKCKGAMDVAFAQRDNGVPCTTALRFSVLGSLLFGAMARSLSHQGYATSLNCLSTRS